MSSSNPEGFSSLVGLGKAMPYPNVGCFQYPGLAAKRLPVVLPTQKCSEKGIPIPTVLCKTIGSGGNPLPTQGTFSFHSRDHDIFMETRPKVIKPIPMDMPGGQCNFNYNLYTPQLFTSSEVYLNCPIWRQPLQPMIQVINDDYRKSRYDSIDDVHRIIFEDMRDMNK
jgi:hypothetical protein